ncbi:MAG: aminodeoxychorismate lyase [Gammaproteobacteria bacterium]
MKARRNGRPERAALAWSRGLHYGDGVFRTLLKYQSQIIDIEHHLKKISDDCARLHLAPPDHDALYADSLAVSRERETAVIKWLVLRQAGDRGYAPGGEASERLVLCAPPPSYPAACWTQGIRALRSAVTLAPQPLLAGVKHLNRLEQVLASRGWPDGVLEALQTDPGGHPLCGTRSNLFWVKNGCLYTPDLGLGGVCGIMRNKIMHLAHSLNIPLYVVRAPWQSLLEADEAFICNALIGLWPLRALDERRWPAPGPVSRRLQAALAHPRLVAA